jgi:hypothetical protein
MRIGTLLDRITEVCSSESPLIYRISGYTLIAVFGLLASDMLLLGAAPITGPWDVMVLLDSGWRVLNGQVPNTDYHNPVGPLQALLISFGLRFGRSTSSICYAMVLLLALLLPWAWWIARRRLPALLALIFVAFLGLLLVSPRPLGYGVRETTYAMIYNEQGYVLLSMFLLGTLLPERPAEKQAVFFGGLSAGLLLGLMLYCKVTYFLAAFVTIPLVLFVRRPQAIWGVGAAAGFAAIVVAFEVFFRISALRYLADVAVAGHSQSLATRVHLLISDFLTEAKAAYLICLCLGLWAWAEGVLNESRRRAWLPALIAIWVIGAALVVQTGNAAEGTDNPLYFTAAVLIAELYRRRNPSIATSGSTARLAYMASVLIVIPLVAGAIALKDAASFSYATLWNIEADTHFDPSRYIHSQYLRDFRVPSSTDHITAYWPARDHPANINDGIDLLRRHVSAGDKVTALAYSNPFSFALGLPPARDGDQFWDLNISFDAEHAPPPSRVLGDALWVMVPKAPASHSQGWNFDTLDVLLRLYGAYMRANYRLADASAHWLLYRRRGTSGRGGQHTLETPSP